MTLDRCDDLAADWDTREDARIYAEQAFQSWNRKIAPLVSNLAESRVLDFGCGTGLLTEKLAPLCGHIVAVDTSRRMIEILRRKVEDGDIGNITPLETAINSVTIAQNRELSDAFDLIVASSVCSFLSDYNATLRDLSSLMKPGGLFVQWDWLDRMTKDRIRNAYEASGLIKLGVEEAYIMEIENESMPVVMGMARLPLAS